MNLHKYFIINRKYFILCNKKEDKMCHVDNIIDNGRRTHKMNELTATEIVQ